MSRKIQFGFLFLLLGLLSAGAQSVFAQADLQFENNFFVTGDYVVAGAYGLNLVDASGYTSGLITVPDVNPGITGTKLVPTGAQIVSALLYWQTVETIPGSGANGFFRPVYLGGPLTPYSITGVNVGGNNTVYWSSSGCTGTKTGEVVRTYRADVRALLPQDANGNVLANGVFQVTLPSTGNSTPLTLGATLVIIYRVLSPNIPLNSIVIYDGAFALTSASLTMQGFYDAAQNPVSRLTQIVGAGKGTNHETVSLDNTSLPSPYGPLPAFPGFYGHWDNTTWTFGSPYYPAIANPVHAGDTSATTEVVSSGCLAWGAVIVSTTVQNSDNDGLLDAWKEAQGYCDVAVLDGRVCTTGDPSWVDLPGAKRGEQDVFVQLDYMCSSVTGVDSCSISGDYFDPRLTFDSSSPPVSAAQKVVNAYLAKGIHVHINPTGGYNLFYTQNVHAIPEPTCKDFMSVPELCPFPNQPGVVGWTGGFVGFKNQLVDTSGSTSVSDCAISSPPADCMPRFQHGRKDSWHYALFAHALALPNWTLAAKTLTSVVQSGQTVTFTTSTPHMLAANAYDTSCTAYGRVTVAFAITNPHLNGTYCVTEVPSPTTFTIQVANSTSAAYTFSTDPNLAIASGVADDISGFSDIGGANSLIALGSWGANGQTWQTQAGTFAHEFGHSNGLTHGAYYFDQLSSNPNNYTPTIEANCKPNFQSVMSYAFQVDLLDVGEPLNVVDYSEQDLSTLNESIAESDPLTNPAPSYLSTSWYIPWPGVGTPATRHCDGTPLLPTDQKMSRFTGPTASLSWTADQDINFDGKIETSLRGHNDWTGTGTSPGIDLRQVGATGSLTVAGGLQGLGGGGGLQGLGGGGGLQGLGGGGGLQGLGGGGGVGELTQSTANSVTRPPRNLTASEGASPRTITLTWTQPTFGQIVQYNVYQSANGGAFELIASVTGTPPVTTYTATVTCNPGGYTYFVTALINVGTPPVLQESVPSNTVPAPGQNPLTGCYTLTGFSSPAPGANVIQGSLFPITWALQDDFYTTGAYVNNPTANTLLAIGPIAPTSTDGPCPQTVPANATVTTLLSQGTPTVQSSGSTFGVSAEPNYQFTFNWNTTLFSAGCYFFQLNLDSKQSETTTSPLQVLIYVSDTGPYITTTTLPNGVVGRAYSNTIDQAGGIGAVTWSIISGTLPPGITLNSAAGTVSGTPTAPGVYNFTAEATDSEGNYGTRALTLSVADAQYGDLIVVDGSPSANPLAGTLFRISPSGTAGTIAAISNGSPTGVGVDATTGNIYVAADAVGGSGTTRIVKISQFGAVTDPFASGGLQNPVAVAVDSSGNVYVADNNAQIGGSKADVIYKFNTLGTQVDANGNPTVKAFAQLPSSPSLNDIRMAFDSSGNLDVASDGLTTGPVEVDQIAATGVLTVLYNTTTNSNLSPPIGTVGGIAVLSNGSIDVADYGAEAIDNITNPGTESMAITTAISAATLTNANPPPFPLCCNISGMANPPSAMNTTLYVTLNGVGTGTPQLQLAVPQTSSVTIVNSTQTYSLTAASAAVGGYTTYTGTFSPTIPANAYVTIAGFTNATNNGPSFTVVSCTSTQLVLNNPSGVAETNPAGTAVTATPLTFPNDVAWYDYPPPG